MKKSLLLLIVLVCGLCFQSCTGDEPDYNSNSSTNNKNKEVNPDIDDIMSATTLTDFTVTFKVKSVEMPNVLLKYSRETTTTSSPSLDKSSTPHLIKKVDVHSGGYSYYYYRATHTGFNGGNRIYFQIHSSNSKGSDKSSIRYCIIKR